MAQYKITGLTVDMNTFGRTLVQAEPYRCGEGAKADIVIRSDWKTLQARQPDLSDEDCEYLMTGDSFYRQLLSFDGMLLHASAVVMDGQAYLFSAPCGTGKSTHTALWCKVFGPERARILNDDKPALRLEDGRFYAYGTPWSGKTDQNLNLRVPVAGICLLGRGTENKIVPYGGTAAIYDILTQTIRPKDPGLTANLLELMDKLLRCVSVWKLQCNMDPEAAIVSHGAMSGSIGKVEE